MGFAVAGFARPAYRPARPRWLRFGRYLTCVGADRDAEEQAGGAHIRFACARGHTQALCCGRSTLVVRYRCWTHDVGSKAAGDPRHRANSGGKARVHCSIPCASPSAIARFAAYAFDYGCWVPSIGRTALRPTAASVAAGGALDWRAHADSDVLWNWASPSPASLGLLTARRGHGGFVLGDT